MGKSTTQQRSAEEALVPEADVATRPGLDLGPVVPGAEFFEEEDVVQREEKDTKAYEGLETFTLSRSDSFYL